MTMSILKEDLRASNANLLNAYFPARTKQNESAFDWEVAKGVVIRKLYGKSISKKFGSKDDSGVLYQRFREICRDEFAKRLDETELWPYLDDMYFSPAVFYDIAPECILFKISNLSRNDAKNSLGDLFLGLMRDCYIESPEKLKRNFLEQQVVDSLRSTNVLEDYVELANSTGIPEVPFLPFLARYFSKDLKFLSDHPDYLVQNLEALLKLYGYLYTAQLALNIKGLSGEPESRPLFFILDSESASLERTDLVKNGHQNVASKIKYIYPYLSMAETLQSVSKSKERMPLWDLASKITSDDCCSLKEYAKDFRTNRGFDIEFDEQNQDAHYWLKTLLDMAVMQFSKGQSKAAALGRFVSTTEKELLSTFVTARGRVGNVLVMNQDYLIMLTNLAVGVNQRLRLHELLEEFRARGVYFDKVTQQKLVSFYERVGNIERMSDSGDAVYVRKTI